jgi:hypothetical protein
MTDATRVPKLTEDETIVLTIMFESERNLDTHDIAYRLFKRPETITAEQVEHTERILRTLHEHGLIGRRWRRQSEH